jgi:hypothetical protein
MARRTLSDGDFPWVVSSGRPSYNDKSGLVHAGGRGNKTNLILYFRPIYLAVGEGGNISPKLVYNRGKVEIGNLLAWTRELPSLNSTNQVTMRWYSTP